MFNPRLSIQKCMLFLTWQFMMVPKNNVTVYWIVTFYKMYLIGIYLSSQEDIGFRKREKEDRNVKGKERGVWGQGTAKIATYIYLLQIKSHHFPVLNVPMKHIINHNKQKTIIVSPPLPPWKVHFRILWYFNLTKTEQSQNAKLRVEKLVSVNVSWWDMGENL